MEGLMTIGQMARRLGVAVVTLRRWDRLGKLKPTLRTAGGHRRYGVAPAASAGKTLLHARVSCSDQKDDLERQKARLMHHAAATGWSDCELIAELGSGLNFRKRGLLRLLDLVLGRSASRLVVENKDRLLSFGADLVFRLCRCLGIEVAVVDAPADRRPCGPKLRSRPGKGCA